MMIRSSENSHQFQNALFQALDAYSVQGLLIDERGNFTAAVEAVEYGPNEDMILPFSNKELAARWIFAESLRIPFYIVVYRKGVFMIIQVYPNKATPFVKLGEYNEDGFVRWWGSLKGMPQRKRLNNGGEERLLTVFDRVLRRHGMEWGGNIDGFVVSFEEGKITAIIDNISCKNDLSSAYSDPARFFSSTNPRHGPKYEGWYGAIKTSSTLQVPHLLFTIDKSHPEVPHIGCTAFRKLSAEGIFYHGGRKPNEHIITGMDNILSEVESLIATCAPPVLVERNR